MSVSVKDVAAAASVSVGTVSNVLNHPDKVSPATVERVLRVIDELGFVRNDAARQLRAGRSRTVGLIVPDIGNPFFTAVARGAEERASAVGMAVLVASSDDSVDREARYLDLFSEQRVAGVLITPASARLERLERVRDAGIPVVLVDRDESDAGFSAVSVDDVEGGFVAASHLLSGGRRRLAFVNGPSVIRQAADRLVGARRAVAQVDGASLEVIEVEAQTVLHGRAAGEEISRRDPRHRPDAVFAANDLLAIGVLQALSLLRDVRVPDDIALIGYDDIDFAASTVVPLTSIRQPAQLIGDTAVELLLAELDGTDRERTVLFRPELIVRESTAPREKTA